MQNGREEFYEWNQEVTRGDEEKVD